MAENKPLEEQTGFLANRVRDFEDFVGDVGEFSTDGSGLLGTPIPQNLNPINPFSDSYNTFPW